MTHDKGNSWAAKCCFPVSTVAGLDLLISLFGRGTWKEHHDWDIPKVGAQFLRKSKRTHSIWPLIFKSFNIFTPESTTPLYSKRLLNLGKRLFKNFPSPFESNTSIINKTLPKALRTQALTALTSNFGLVWWVLFGSVSFVGWVWFALVSLVWKVR